MIPPIVEKSLAAVRRRERFVSFVWGFAKLLSVVAVVLAFACWLDWWIDRRRDTPELLRKSMYFGQIGLLALLAAVWLLPPLVRRRSESDIALFVEARQPELGHRLISAVQLNQPGADVSGMSPAMIAEVSREAEEAARNGNFTRLVDHRRLRFALLSLGALAAVFAGFQVLLPQTLQALLRRQVLQDVDIPRNFQLTNKTTEVWPAGEPAVISLAYSHNSEQIAIGEVQVEAENKQVERFPVSAGPYGGTATLEVPGSLGDCSFTAWIGDGRLKHPGQIRRVPRPAIVRQEAWTLLPSHVGTLPDGKPFALPQSKGEIVGLPGSSGLIAFESQKPIVKATLELLGIATANEAANADGPIVVLRRLPLDIRTNGMEGGGSFDLRPAEIAYRIVMTDEYGFSNLDPPRRSIKIVDEDAPQVVLMPEQFASQAAGLLGRSEAEDFEVEGVPIPTGGSIRIAYAAMHPYGLGAARLRYRINEGPWRVLPLTERSATQDTGPWDSRTGAFVNSRASEQVQFHAVPSADPTRFLSRIEGGGRLDFQTRGLTDLKIGDKIEFFVEVSNRQTGEPKWGSSEVRQKTVVTVSQLVQWIDTTLRQEDRIRALEQRQRGVFGR